VQSSSDHERAARRTPGRQGNVLVLDTFASPHVRCPQHVRGSERSRPSTATKLTYVVVALVPRRPLVTMIEAMMYTFDDFEKKEKKDVRGHGHEAGADWEWERTGVVSFDSMHVHGGLCWNAAGTSIIGCGNSRYYFQGMVANSGCVCFAAPAPHSPWGLGVVEPTTSRKHPKPPCVNVLVALAGTPMTTRLLTSPSGSTNEKSMSISNGSVPWPVFEPNTHTLGAPGCCADCACPSPSLPLSSLSFRS